MTEKKPVLHILVIGFHHKKGCQVEFSYPPLISGTGGTNECPSGWKYLPTLALPDGSHNFVEDSVFFNLPSLTEPKESVYGVSCYRQIPVEKLKNRTPDVTRSTVQKSVCALASIPVYGYIEVKLSLIAQCFFDQGDFSLVEILKKAYEQLNSCLLSDDFNGIVNPLRHINVGLPLRDIVLKWRHKTMLLFKLMLLQKRVVCFGSPVRPLCSLILSIASLHPRLLGFGFQQVACVRTSRPMSPMPDFPTPNAQTTESILISSSQQQQQQQQQQLEPEHQENNIPITTTVVNLLREEKKLEQVGEENSKDFEDEKDGNSDSDQQSQKSSTNGGGNSSDLGKRADKNSLPRDASVDALATSLLPLCSVNPITWGAPLSIFQNGNLCLPYLSLPYMDLLTDPSVVGYTIGTSNILFQQKKQLADVLIDVETATMETQDTDLRRQLQLTTEDLRFVDFIIRHVQNPKEDAEGSENWIREQFQGYMLAILKTSLMPDGCKEIEHFNGYFMSTFKRTNAYLDWLELKLDENVFEGIPSGHPFAGTLSVADMKLRLAQTMHNTESGRKLNQAVNNTSRAVGGALSQAKGAFSNWWSSITTSPPSSINQQSSNPQNDDKSLVGSNLSLSSIKEKQPPPSTNNKENKMNLENSDKSLVCEPGDNNKHSNETSTTTTTLTNKELTTNRKIDGIIEIAKEAEILDSNIDSNRKIGNIYTV